MEEEAPSLPYDCIPIVAGPTTRHAQWPPKIVKVERLGYIVDKNGRRYPRDIGRSSTFGDNAVVFQFGDTFAHNDAGEFVGGTSSTAAVVQDAIQSPTVTSYILDTDGCIPSFIPMEPEERTQHGKRTTLWCFGGIIEIGEADGDVAAGWVFYQKGSHLYLGNGGHILDYTGAAKVYYDLKEKKIIARRAISPLILFQKDEPSFGTFSAVRQGDEAYLFGHAPNSTKVMLAKVNIRWVLDRSRYTYWDGQEYQADICKAKQIMEDVQHGAIYCSKLFGPNKDRDWVFVGCSRFGDNKVLIGVSANLEGPYQTAELIDTFSIIPMPKVSSRYCIYPHPWAFKEEEGMLLITWSEGSIEGGVVAVKVHFAMTMEKGRPSAGMEGKGRRSCSSCVVS